MGRFRQILLLAAIALGFSSAVFLEDLALLASPDHIAVYHFPGKPSALFIPAIVNTLLLAAACFVLLLWTRRRPASKIVWSFLLCIYPWIVVRGCCHVLDVRFSRWESVTIFALCGAAFVVLAFGRRSEIVNLIYECVHDLGGAVLAASGMVGAITLLQITFFGFEARHLNDAAMVDTVTHRVHAAPQHRVVWLILDELAYRQLYEHRLRGLQLPAFDQLRAESTVFTDVQSAGIRTEVVIPALMTGDAINSIRATPEGELTIHDAQGWHSFDQRNTIFADADALGFRTSIVGWFNPYCRILPNVLDSCFWANHSFIGGTFVDDGVKANLLDPFKAAAEKLGSILDFRSAFRHRGLAPADVADGEEHIEDFVELKRTADAALMDPRNSFVFLHMPVPHPRGIWDRRTSGFAIDHSSYVDNLVLADRYLAHLRHLLEADGQWDNTTVVIMGDHGWRARLLWKGATGWSHDDEVASDDGSFDPRPAYIVKLPNQHTEATVDSSFPAVGTRPLLDQLLLGRITNSAQLQKWAQGFQMSPSTGSRVRPAARPGTGNHS